MEGLSRADLTRIEGPLKFLFKVPLEGREKTETIEKSQIVETAKPISASRESKQTPIIWCGGTNPSHDVTICLVLYRINQFSTEGTEHDRQALAKVKVHSSRLSECSKYFETCLAERWKKPVSSTGSSSEFVLETHGDVRYYTDCFHRMYSPPFSKDFKDVNYSLGLLKAASHIQFHKLMDSVALYLSSKLWSDTDEMAIRMYASGHDFPRNHAQDLVVRLGMDESKEECHKQLCDMIEQCIRSALAYDGNFRSNRAFFKEMLPGSLPGIVAGSGQGGGLLSPSSNSFGFGQKSNGSSNGSSGPSVNSFGFGPSNGQQNNGGFFSSTAHGSGFVPNITPSNGQGNGSLSSSLNALGFKQSSAPSTAASTGLGNELSKGEASGLSVQYPNCTRDVVTIVSREAKNMVVKIAKECEGKAYTSVPRFAEKILAICWILETLLAARVAEEFIQCFVHLHALPKILLLIEVATNTHMPGFGANFSTGEYGVNRSEARNAAVELAKLVLVIYQEVAAGNLLLKTPERIALLENWHLLFGKLLVLTNCSFDQATKDLFTTLPLKQQMLIVKVRKDSGYESYISTNSLANLVKKQWPTVE